MIEFKAECGHTVRARDEDAGGTVRCSYCGKPAEVPDSQSSELDFLLQDLGGEEDGGRAKGKPPKARRLARRRRRSSGEFNPFTIIIKLCYVALLFCVAIVVLRMFVMPLFKDGGFQKAIQGNLLRPDAPERPQRPDPTPARPAQFGLIARDQIEGLFVTSTPPGAAVYYLKSSEAPDQGRIHSHPNARQFRTTGRADSRIADGMYIVEVVFPWNARQLTGYRDYEEFRRAVETADFEKRKQLASEYFLPDDADEVFIDQTPEQIYLVRQYRNVEIRNRRSISGVRALFLPRILKPDGRTYLMSEIVEHYLPTEQAYAFEEEHVRNELKYYRVPEEDREYVVLALKRIGVIPYRLPEGLTRLFKIGLEDGVLLAPVIRTQGG